MSFIKAIKGMDQKFSWSFLGFVLALILGSITIYTEYFKTNAPDINFIIKENTNVLDIRENLGKLDVHYQGESLSKKKQDLSLMTFEVINQGNEKVLSSFYDKNDLLGFEIIEGKIADTPSVIEVSNEYLKRNLAITQSSNSTATFSEVILEPNESFKIKLLILHSIEDTPTIKPIGKIAGVSKLDVFTDFLQGTKTSFWSTTFGGGLTVNLIRIVAYGIMALWSLGMFVVFVESIRKRAEKSRKQKLISTFKDYDSEKITGKDEFFFEYFLSDGYLKIQYIYELLSDTKLTLQINSLSQPSSNDFRERELVKTLNELITEGFISINDSDIYVDQDRLIIATDFFNFLNRKDEYKRNSSIVVKND